MLDPWMIRNAISVGKMGITEDYGFASMIDRLAFDNMTAKKFALPAPYCFGTIGPPPVDGLRWEEAMNVSFSMSFPRCPLLN